MHISSTDQVKTKESRHVINHSHVINDSSDTSFKKTFCLMNIRPQDLLSHEPTLWFRRHQLFWFRRTTVRSVSNTRIFIDLHLSRLMHLHDARRLSHVRGVSVWTCPRGAILKSPAISRKEYSLFSHQVPTIQTPLYCHLWRRDVQQGLLEKIPLFWRALIQKRPENTRGLLIGAHSSKRHGNADRPVQVWRKKQKERQIQTKYRKV